MHAVHVHFCLSIPINAYDDAVSSDGKNQASVEKDSLRRSTFPSGFEVTRFMSLLVIMAIPC